MSDSTRPRATRYSRVAIVLHWSIAALVLATIPIGWYGASTTGAAPPSASAPRPAAAAPRQPPAPPQKSDAQQAATNLHKTIGILILSLTVLRVGWRLTHRPPAWPDSLARPLRHAFGFGFVDIPFLPVPQSWAAAGSAKFVHTNLAWLMAGLAVLHILAALKHHVIDKDDVLMRMLPRRS